LFLELLWETSYKNGDEISWGAVTELRESHLAHPTCCRCTQQLAFYAEKLFRSRTPPEVEECESKRPRRTRSESFSCRRSRGIIFTNRARCELTCNSPFPMRACVCVRACTWACVCVQPINLMLPLLHWHTHAHTGMPNAPQAHGKVGGLETTVLTTTLKVALAVYR
jgi:hypothetical protein